MKNALKLFVTYSLVLIVLTVMLPYSAYAGEILTPSDLAKEFTFKDDGLSCVAEYFADCDQFLIALLPDFTEAEWNATDSKLQTDYMNKFDSICNHMISILDGIGYSDTIVVGLMMTSDPEFIAFSVDGHNLQDVIG